MFARAEYINFDAPEELEEAKDDLDIEMVDLQK